MKFQIFKDYGWSGPSIDGILAEAADIERSASKSHGAGAALDDFFQQPRVKIALGRAKLLRVSQEVAETFAVGDRPSLFLELAATEITSRGMLDFVRRNGVLDERRDKNSALDLVGEIRWMRRALEYLLLWRDSAEASRPRSARRAAQSIVPNAGQAFESQIRHALRQCMNNRLSAVPAPLFDENLRLSSNTPRLADAIWFQFAKAIDAGRQINRCRRCLKFFEVASGESRTDKSWCGNSCKVGAFRERKRQAAKLRSQGMTPREIAKQLGSDVSTVKGWISKSEEK